MPQPLLQFRYHYNRRRPICPGYSLKPLLDTRHGFVTRAVPAAAMVVPQQDQARIGHLVDQSSCDLRPISHHSGIAASVPFDMKGNGTDFEFAVPGEDRS